MSTTPTLRRSSRTTNAPSSSSRGQVILVNDTTTPTRPAKRPRTTTSTPRRTSTRIGTPKAAVTPKRRTQEAKSSKDGSDDEASSASSSDDDPLSTIKIKSANTDLGKNFVHQSTFDAYFAAASKPSRTSNNVFSQLVPPLTSDEYASLLRTSTAAHKNAAELEQVLTGHERLFPRYALELAEGFNLLFFGFGSKRMVLDAFARKVCARRGHVVMVNGYAPRVGIKDVLARIEEVPGLADAPFPAGTAGVDAQTQRIYNYFLPPAVCPTQPTSARPLFLVIHNIDTPALRAPKAKAPLSLLALNPRIHVIASIDHVHAQMIWSTAEASARKHVYEGGKCDMPPTRGFAWVWHDLTTMQPYDAELAHVDMSRVGKTGGKAGGVSAERAMTETAAQHILASVNAKAKKLFALLAKTQLASFEEGGAKEKQMQQHAVSYEALFNAARTDFIATNDTAFKALLAEFRDHKLVVSSAGGGESLWIPLKADELRRLTTSIVTEQ